MWATLLFVGLFIMIFGGVGYSKSGLYSYDNSDFRDFLILVLMLATVIVIISLINILLEFVYFLL